LDPIVDARLLGLVLVQNAPLMHARGLAARNVVGNNPLACCAPGNPPFVFDGALSQYSLAALLDSVQQGRLPAGAVLDASGKASDDPQIVRRLAQGDREQGGLASLGGIKGLGLAMCIEFLAGALTGGFYEPPPGKPWGEGALVVALSAGLFHTAHMLEHIQSYLNQFTSYPGLHARQVAATAVIAPDAIAYPAPTLQALNTAAEQRGLAVRITFS
jgi:LDH2 family malate/lactate/ureidoglycolate dehydrogenase